jgi:hypothetical protein
MARIAWASARSNGRLIDTVDVLTKLSLGDAAQYGALVQLSPLAFAVGWGLFAN